MTREPLETRTAAGDERSAADTVDTTARRRAETDLTRAKRQFEMVIDGLDALVLVCDVTNQDILFANAACLRRYGPVAGRRCWEFLGCANFHTCGPCGGHFGEGAQELPATERSFELRCEQDDRWYRCTVRLIPWDGRDTVRLLMATDITDSKTAEIALLAAKERADQASASKTRFLAAASHDLRQPAQAIRAYIEVLASMHLPEDAQRVVGRLVNSLATMDSILVSLLDVSRLDAGVVPVTRKPVPIGPLLARLAGEFDAVALRKRLSIRYVTSTAVAECDPDLLLSMLRNIVSNAVKFSQRGRVLIGTRRRGSHLEILVMDTGPGIPSHEQSAIFEEFYQVAGTGQNRQKGLGLGLAIVDRLSRLLDIPVRLRSQAGRGTTFMITVPLCRTDAVQAVGGTAASGQASSNVLHAPPPPQHSQTVPAPAPAPVSVPANAETTVHWHLRDASRRSLLLIDDNDEVRDGLGSLLDQLGFSVMVAASADQAVALAGCGASPDAIVCDYRLSPEQTGLATIGRFRAQLGRAIPALLITGDTSAATLSRLTQSGVAFLHKPVSAEQLSQALSRMLRT